MLILDADTPDLWSRFLSGGPVAPPLAERWTRARALGVRPDGAADPEGIDGARLRERSEALESRLGGASLEAMASFSELGYAALLCDPDGYVVSARPSAGFDSTAARVRLVPGASWAEATRGTNAIGTALTERRAVAVLGAAHWEARNHGLVCYAAPIRAPSGRLLGVFDVTSDARLANPLVGALVQTVAASLEAMAREAAWARAAPGGRRALSALVRRSRDLAWLAEPSGELAAASERGASAASLREAVGLPWSTLEAAARAGVPLEDPRQGRRLEVEPVMVDDEVIALVVLAAEGRPRTEHLVLPAAPVAPATAPRVASARQPTSAPTPPRAPPVDLGPFARLQGDDPAIRDARTRAAKFAGTALPLLVLAETGTGKELLARAIHAASPRRDKPFVALNCGAIAPTLLESELFGYGPGAFTGASARGHAGKIATAHGGTLFLDEVGEMPAALQAALLRVLEDGSYTRVGESKPQQADIRLVCATCRDLPAMVAVGTFRKDLYFRIRGATLGLPPLRARRDRLELADALLTELRERDRGPRFELADDARQAILAHDWPGNVRELKLALEHARVLAEGGVIRAADLPDEVRVAAVAAVPSPPSVEGALRANADRQALAEALARSGGNLTQAARLLGVARTTLYRMLERFGLG